MRRVTIATPKIQRSTIFAVDFDGTVVTHEYPKLGRNIGAEDILRRLTSNGHRLILWTMRDRTELDEAVDWYRGHQVPLFGVNKNPEQTWSSSPKAYAHYYIDDLALGIPLTQTMADAKPFVDWKAMELLLAPWL